MQGMHAQPMLHAHAGPMTIAAITGVSNHTQAHALGTAPATLPGHSADGVPGAQFERYEKTEKLGEGTYGVVYKARDRLRNVLVALKKVRMDAWEEGVPATALREISVLKEVKHPHIVALEDVFVSFSGNLYLVFELLAGDLKVFMDARRETGAEPELVKRFLWQMTSGIAACHEHRIVHRDLKPQNVLLDNVAPTPGAAVTVKIADFGLSRTYALPLRVYTHEVVTLWYRCPEILLGLDAYSTAVDVWSLGCMFGEMSAGHPMFTGDSEVDQLFRIFQKLGTPTPERWPQLPSLPDYTEAFPKFRCMPWERIAPRLDPLGRDLLSKMLVFDPAARISAAEALKHPYFASLAAPDVAMTH